MQVVERFDAYNQCGRVRVLYRHISHKLRRLEGDGLVFAFLESEECKASLVILTGYTAILDDLTFAQGRNLHPLEQPGIAAGRRISWCADIS